MAQVSKHPLSKAIYERIFEIFIKSIVSIKDKKEAEDFLNDFLTPTERIMLAKRLAIAVLLTKGYDYASIRKILHVSFSTVASVSVFLKYTGEGYKKVVDKLLKEEAIKDFLLSIGEDFAAVGSIGGKGSGAWRDVKKSIQKKRKSKPF